MSKMEGLRAGIVEMRSVAKRLNQWADDLEASFQAEKADAQEVSAPELVPNEKEKEAVAPATVKQTAAPEKRKTYTLPEVRAILAEKVAQGFGTQVKALIESYGAASLKGVPAECYEGLLDAVKGLGDVDAG